VASDMQIVEEYWKLRDNMRSRIFAHLNPDQLKAAETGQGPVLCLAGAGSGKTTAMVYRILHLYIFGPSYDPRPQPPDDLGEKDLTAMREWLDESRSEDNEVMPPRLVELIRRGGVHPRSILAITFTNKAAEEMQNRIALLLKDAMRYMWVMNFHKACVRILRREITALGYTGDFTIYDAQDQLQVIKRVSAELNLDDKDFPPRALSGLISRFKSELKSSREARKEPLDYWQEKGVRVYELYQKYLKQGNALDFDDLIMLTVQLFRENTDILEKYRERFQYILVDEYQDTNHAQYVLIDLLAHRHRNLFVVGDDDQSIYAFRQADIRNILEFERDYPGARVIKLEQNYRSTQTILEAANEVISHNAARKQKKLWTKNPQGELLLQYRAEDEQDEARFISDRIKELVDKGRRYQDCVVLIRTNAQSRVMEEWFMKRGIPYKIVGGQKFYERKEIKDILAYLKFLVNPSDSVSMQRIINVPRRGIGETTVGKIVDLSRINDIPVYEALSRYSELNLGPKASRAIDGFISLVEKLREHVDEISITALTEKILMETGYSEELLRENTIEAQSRLENLKEFLTVTQDYDRKAEEPSLGDFLSQVSLVTDLDTYEDEAEAVVIMTMHMAKGLEFPHVFLAGMEEGIFPHSRSLLEESELEEERRLCYVAITRAREKVYLIYARQRNLFGRRSYNMPSRFLEEIPSALWEEYKSEAGFYKTTWSGAPFAGQKGTAPKEIGLFLLGDKVEHSKWGQGVVVGAKGKGEDTELQVAFPGQGIKTLLARFAPLRKVK